jgi:hypothetical protein
VVSWYTPRWCLLEHLEGGKGPRRERYREKRGRDWSSPSSCHGAVGRRMQRRAACFFHAAALDLHFPWWVVGFGQQAGRKREKETEREITQTVSRQKETWKVKREKK